MIDFFSVVTLLSPNQEDALCGGRHHQYYKIFNDLFASLTNNGAKIVFFSDLNLQEGKKVEWIDRRNSDYEEEIRLFDELAERPLSEMVNRNPDDQVWVVSATDILNKVASQYGNVHYSTHNECDRELARYATDNNAMAVFSDDSDFFIFEGGWKLWSVKEMKTRLLITRQFNRDVVFEHFGLERRQLALLATLLGNDFTKAAFKDDLNYYHTRLLGSHSDRVIKIRDHIRDMNMRASNDREILSLARKIVLHSSDYGQVCATIADSLQFYDLNFIPTTIEDPFHHELIENQFRSVYQYSVATLHKIEETFNDLRCKDIKRTFRDAAMELQKKLVGIIKFHEIVRPITYLVGSKRTHDEGYQWTEEDIFYPEGEFWSNRFCIETFHPIPRCI